jgi:hypothetical protein
LSEDPIGLAGGMNLYTFAGGDPVNMADPTGLRDIPWYTGNHRGWEVGAAWRMEMLIDASNPGATWWDEIGACGSPDGGGGVFAHSGESSGRDVNQGCAGALISTAFSFGTDVMMAFGVGAAAKLTRVAGLAGRGGTKAAVRTLRTLERWVAKRLAAGGRIGATRAALGLGAADLTMGASARAVQGEETSFWRAVQDMIPIWGTARAAWDAAHACGWIGG